MQKKNSRTTPFWLLVVTAISAALLGFLIVWLAGSGPSVLSRQRLVLGESDETSAASQVAQSQQTPTVQVLTPTFVPLEEEQTPSPLPSPSTVDEPVPEPTVESVPTTPSTSPPAPIAQPTAPPAPVVRPTLAPPVPVRVEGPRVRLEDTAWAGGYRQARGYAGRTATWIYGSGTDYSTMQAAFTLAAQPQGPATLWIEGMDSEGRAKTPIAITVNGSVIFRGPNPLPDDDLPLESGTWARARWSFDAALLQPGSNVIRIQNVAQGAFGRPPFFMLDYADLVLASAEDAPAPQPTNAPAPLPEPTAAPTDVPAPTPEPPIAPSPTPEAPPAEPTAGSSTEIRLEDTAWAGGYRQARGYAGRTATWIYGSGTEYSTMQAAFTLAAQPQGPATLWIEGMDSEGRAKTPIAITVNGSVIFRGPNPLPDDDLPLESGTWARARWSFDAALLQPGSNVIRIQNVAQGAFGRPPFFMLDYAIVAAP